MGTRPEPVSYVALTLGTWGRMVSGKENRLGYDFPWSESRAPEAFLSGRVWDAVAKKHLWH